MTSHYIHTLLVGKISSMTFLVLLQIRSYNSILVACGGRTHSSHGKHTFFSVGVDPPKGMGKFPNNSYSS